MSIRSQEMSEVSETEKEEEQATPLTFSNVCVPNRLTDREGEKQTWMDEWLDRDHVTLGLTKARCI